MSNDIDVNEVRLALLRAWFAMMPAFDRRLPKNSPQVAKVIAEQWAEDCYTVLRQGQVVIGNGHLDLALPELVQGWIEKVLAAGS